MRRRSFLASVGGVGFSTSFSRRYSVDSYERKYEVVEETPLDVGAVYIPFMADKWERCTPGMPAVGEYSITDTDVVNRHIDQMQGHGITTLTFNYGESRNDFDRVRGFLDAELSAEIAIETMWVIMRIFTRDLDIDLFMKFARENLLSLPNHRRVDGRPVVQLWGSNYLPWDDETAAEIREQYGGFREFADYIRAGLTIDGTEPYLVSSIIDVPDDGLVGDEAVWNQQFDAVTTWFPNPRTGEKTSWDWHTKRAKGDFEVLGEFAENHGIELIPTAFPGRDERKNSCWGTNPYVPRAPSHLEEMLELCNQFRTTNKLNIATFNDWVEGHQIEPGRWNGESYGTDYLAKVKDLQSAVADDSTPTATTVSSPSPTETPTRTTSQTETTPTRPTENRTETDAESPGFGTAGALTGIAGLAGYLGYRGRAEK